MKIEMSREEALVSLIALEKIKKPYYWHKKAVNTLVNILQLSPPDKRFEIK